jgi:hypothetical protein
MLAAGVPPIGVVTKTNKNEKHLGIFQAKNAGWN